MVSHSLLCVLYAQRTTLTKCCSERVTLVRRHEWGNTGSPSPQTAELSPQTPTKRKSRMRRARCWSFRLPTCFLRGERRHSFVALQRFHGARHAAAAQVAGAGAVNIEISSTEKAPKIRTGSDNT